MYNIHTFPHEIHVGEAYKNGTFSSWCGTSFTLTRKIKPIVFSTTLMSI